jgi:hypothetical protein
MASYGVTLMPANRPRLVIDASIPSPIASQIAGLWKWFKEYAEENLPNEELAPGVDGLPPECSPELDEVKKVEQVEVVEATDIGRGHLNVRCRARLVVSVSLNDAADTVVTIRPVWELVLLVEPASQTVLEHSHGWDSAFLPDE